MNHTFKTEDLATEKSGETLTKAFKEKIDTGDDMCWRIIKSGWFQNNQRPVGS